ncbi:hypothetical protein [Nocardia sp. NBC_00403]|uniref:hypothetical protein n=1 Tax=Nocardia sp. NBC_00403 TaxID=2975990 RepID=UPI002E1FD3AB
MNERSQDWLYTVSRDHQNIVLTKTPLVSYPFGRLNDSETSAGEGAAAHPAAAGNRVYVDDPRVIHGRVSPLPAADTTASAAQATPSADQQYTNDSLPSSPEENGHAQERNHTVSPAAMAEDTSVYDIDPMPQVQAVVNVRKYILSRNSDSGKSAPGQLVAERLSVGWIVYTPAIGRHRGDEDRFYYVADDGELEETSSSVNRSEYIKSFEQRFRQRRALFG